MKIKSDFLFSTVSGKHLVIPTGPKAAEFNGMITLNDTLKNLGAKTVFDQGKCDLTGIAKPKDGNLFLSKVIHKTHIEVDRKGTKAAAVTGATLDVASAMPSPDEIKEVICDRPYAYAIVDTLTMNPIFIGTVNNVE